MEGKVFLVPGIWNLTTGAPLDIKIVSILIRLECIVATVSVKLAIAFQT